MTPPPVEPGAVPWVALVDARLVRVLLLAGVVVVVLVWWLLDLANMLTPWDRVLLPCLATVVGACGVAMVLRPQWQGPDQPGRPPGLHLARHLVARQ